MFVFNSRFGRFYGEGGSGEGGSGTGTPPVETPKVFTQEEVNALLAENKRSLQTKLAETQKKLDEAAKAGQNVTALQSKVKELSDSLLTKEELAKQKEEALKSDFETQIKTTSEAAVTWQQRYQESVFDRELGRAATTHDAFDPDQLALILRGNSTVVEDTDKDGKGTGTFKVLAKVKIEDKELTLPLVEAVGKLRESGKYPNQFKVKGSPGTGITLNNSPNSVDAADGTVPKDMNQFMKYWEKLPASVKGK